MTFWWEDPNCGGANDSYWPISCSLSLCYSHLLIFSSPPPPTLSSWSPLCLFLLHFGNHRILSQILWSKYRLYFIYKIKWHCISFSSAIGLWQLCPFLSIIRKVCRHLLSHFWCLQILIDFIWIFYCFWYILYLSV